MSWAIREGDCVEVMREFDESSVDSVVTDPPYGLEFMGKEWDRLWTEHPNGQRGRIGGRGGMDTFGDSPQYVGGSRAQEWHRTWAVEVLRVLKPGGHLLAFGGTRTYHRLACALEDAGFEIRDCLAYLYGAGFPKSLNLDRLGFFCRCGEGGLQDGEPATEHDLRPVLGADVPATEGLAGGQGALLLEALPEPGPPLAGWSQLPAAEVRAGQSGMEGRGDVLQAARQLPGREIREGASVGVADGSEGRIHHGASAGDRPAGAADADADGGREPRRPQPIEQRPGQPRTVADEPGSQTGGAWPPCPRCSQPLVPRGLGTALKPAFEPVVLARKPLAERNVAQNVLAHGTGALNVDGTRIGFRNDADERESKDKNRHADFGSGARENEVYGEDKRARGEDGNYDAPGRWPANVILDEEAVRLVDEASGERKAAGAYNGQPTRPRQSSSYLEGNMAAGFGYADSGGASRFFYTAKTSRAEREVGKYYGSERNNHPTVKPVDLMQWLCRLVTPPGGLVLDPFTGSGSTGIAALREGFNFLGIEREPSYVEIARARIQGDSPLFNLPEEVVAEP